MDGQIEQGLYELQRKCLRKKGWWNTRKEARKRAKQIFKEGGVHMYPYRCSGCGKVHLTKNILAKGKTL